MTTLFRSLFWRYAWVLVLLLWGGVALSWAGRWYWLQGMQLEWEVGTRKMAHELGVEFLGDAPIREQIYREWGEHNAHAGYVVVANFRTGYRSGFVNADHLGSGGQSVTDFLRLRGDEQTLTRLLNKDAGFANPYLDVYSVVLLPPPAYEERTPIGAVKMAYVVPGYPFGRGYERLWLFASGGSVVLSIVLLVGMVLARRSRMQEEMELPPPQPEGQGLAELETALDEETPVIMDERGREWAILFDGKSLNGWRAQGTAYITEREIALQPWGASLVRDMPDPAPAYQLQLRGRKLAGADGLIVLFTCGEHSLAWVLGGWNNTRSEVAGFESTRSGVEMERFAWYKLDIVVGPDQLEGWINDQVIWKLPRSEVRSSSPDLGFHRGIGIAVWSTLAKFKDIRLLML